MSEFNQSAQEKGDAILAKYAKQSQEKAEKLDLREKVVTVGGKEFTITKWKHMETLSRVPSFMNLWFGHIAAIGMQETMKQTDDFGFMSENTSGDYILHFLKNLDDPYFADYVADFLSNVTVTATGAKVDIDADFENPMDIINLFTEVAKANFMMQLSQTIFSMPQILSVETQSQEK